MKTERQQDQENVERMRADNLRASDNNDAAVAYMTGSWNMRPFVTKMDFGGDETLLHETAKQMHWVPLYSATTVAELRAEVEAWQSQCEGLNESRREEMARADAAERRVAELEKALRGVVTSIDESGDPQWKGSPVEKQARAALTKETP